MDNKEKLEKLKEKIENCENCDLWKTRTNVVPGYGNPEAEIIFIGEGPGKNEDQQGMPFVGRAGKILDKLLEHIGLEREDIYIANILKCRPPENRNPNTSEIKTCTPYLDEQIKIIKPKVVGCLGNFSSKYIMEKFGLKNKIESISSMRGKIYKIKNLDGEIKIIPLFHPAVATYSPSKIEILKKDFEILKKEIN